MLHLCSPVVPSKRNVYGVFAVSISVVIRTAPPQQSTASSCPGVFTAKANLTSNRVCELNRLPRRWHMKEALKYHHKKLFATGDTQNKTPYPYQRVVHNHFKRTALGNNVQKRPLTLSIRWKRRLAYLTLERAVSSSR
eukprot:gb/GEZJ01005793.1/.p1 GENE.gb/GEZJ01005793.1/~~gb/GEZJ01005793.1/.p1  ORF type:complete len:138 (-),score=7.96 gb/GEZJ01005793.1/:309-722(-)